MQPNRNSPFRFVRVFGERCERCLLPVGRSVLLVTLLAFLLPSLTGSATPKRYARCPVRSCEEIREDVDSAPPGLLGYPAFRSDGPKDIPLYVRFRMTGTILRMAESCEWP